MGESKVEKRTEREHGRDGGKDHCKKCPFFLSQGQPCSVVAVA